MAGDGFVGVEELEAVVHGHGLLGQVVEVDSDLDLKLAPTALTHLVGRLGHNSANLRKILTLIASRIFINTFKMILGSSYMCTVGI